MKKGKHNKERDHKKNMDEPCVSGTGGVDLPLVERLLQEALPYAHRVVNVYLVGSRAYGLAGPDSDYDVTVVIESAYDLVGLQFLSFYDGNLNLNIFHLAYFRKLIQQNVVWILTVHLLSFTKASLFLFIYFISI
jgi:hypothetical protein